MRPTTSACPLDISEQTLSAWLDDLLEPAERQKLERHMSECVACQRRLASLQHVSHVLRGQREPQLTARVWRGLQARIADPASRRSAITRGRFPAAAVTTAAAVLIIALFAGVLALRSKYPSGSGSSISSPTATSIATSTARATASPTSASASGNIPTGWTQVGIPDSFIPDIAAAPSSPSVVYTVSTLSSGGVDIRGSHDGGATWQPLSFATYKANSCQIAVDPTDPTDVALVCTPPASSGYYILRSFNGGKTWTQPAINVTVNCYQNMGFADSTLLMAFALCDSASSQTQLFASVNRGPFKRLDTDGKVSGITLGMEIRLITGHGSTYDIQMGAIEYTQNNPPQLADTLIVSQDAGATWKTTTLSDNGASVHLLATDPLDHNWVGAYQNAPMQLALSSDSGQTWRKLPAPWANELGPDFLFVAPDGTVLVTDARATYVNYTSSTFTLYEAAPGAAQWRSALLIPDPGRIFARVVGWDSSGRPTMLWARYAATDGSGYWYLISHPLSS